MDLRGTADARIADRAWTLGVSGTTLRSQSRCRSPFREMAAFPGRMDIGSIRRTRRAASLVAQFSSTWDCRSADSARPARVLSVLV
jgi:hypothetical protein